MSEGRLKAMWGHTSHILAMLANVNRTLGITLGGLRNDTSMLTADDFNPYFNKSKQSTEKPIKTVTMAELREMMPELANNEGPRRIRSKGLIDGG
jgi:hypothetical protein